MGQQDFVVADSIGFAGYGCLVSYGTVAQYSTIEL
jgi:hypothetical protein